MAIEVACPKCQSILKAPEGMQGKKARCKRCQHSFRIPGGDPSDTESTTDAENLSVISNSPFEFDASAGPTATPNQKITPVASDNPFAIPTTTTEPEAIDEKKTEPKSRSKYKIKPEKESKTPPAKRSQYRSNHTANTPRRSKTLIMIVAAVLCMVGGAGGFYAYTVYQKSQENPTEPVAQAPSNELVQSQPKPTPNYDTSNTTKSNPLPAEPEVKKAQERSQGKQKRGPKVSGGMTLPSFAEKPKLFEKSTASIPLEHGTAAVKQFLVGGSEGPVALVMRRTFDGLGGKGIKDTIDRYALNTFRRIDQTEISADAVTHYPRIGDVNPGGDRYAFEHPRGRLSVVQLGTNSPIVNGLELSSQPMVNSDKGKGGAMTPGLAAIYFLTEDKVAIVTMNGVVESWDIGSKKKIIASEAIPGVANLVDRRSIYFHKDRDPDKAQIFAFSGGSIYSVAPGGKPRLALTLPHGATECLALTIDSGGNRIACAYRASKPGDHIRFLHSRIGDPTPGSDHPLDASGIGEPIKAEWSRPETFSIVTDQGFGFSYDADTFQMIAGFRTEKSTLMVLDGLQHWCLLPDAKDSKKSQLVNVIIPPEDYAPSLTGAKWKALALTITSEGLAK